MCEGRDELAYLESFRAHHRLSQVSFDVRPVNGGSPEKIVSEAVRQRAALGKLGPAEAPDAYWVVLDVERDGVAARGACEDAHRRGFGVALSNPCFEVWVLLHHAAGAPALTAKQAKAKCAPLLEVGRKRPEPASFDDPRLAAPWQVAADRARRNRASVCRDESLGPDPAFRVVLARNSGTCVDELLEAAVRAFRLS